MVRARRPRSDASRSGCARATAGTAGRSRPRRTGIAIRRAAVHEGEGEERHARPPCRRRRSAPEPPAAMVARRAPRSPRRRRAGSAPPGSSAPSCNQASTPAPRERRRQVAERAARDRHDEEPATPAAIRGDRERQREERPEAQQREQRAQLAFGDREAPLDLREREARHRHRVEAAERGEAGGDEHATLVRATWGPESPTASRHSRASVDSVCGATWLIGDGQLAEERVPASDRWRPSPSGSKLALVRPAGTACRTVDRRN